MTRGVTLAFASFMLPSLAMSLPAAGQTLGNEVWIGQTGLTNQITILQEGRDNRAGADNVHLLLEQDGDQNVLEITQQGASNMTGVLGFERVRPSGIEQYGRVNTARVMQSNDAFVEGAGNIIGAIYQQSDYFLSGDIFNDIAITQASESAGGHKVGSVTQFHLPATAGAQTQETANSVTIRQSGGGFEAGHLVEDVYQSGSANIVSIAQSDRANSVGLLKQIGTSNSTWIEQDLGRDNAVDVVQQYGEHNQIAAKLGGDGNIVASILQNNEHAGMLGNVVTITSSGTNNGAASLVGGEFRAADSLSLDGIARASLVQLGGGNQINVAIDGVDNRYGISQEGDGNFANLVIADQSPAAAGNEQVVFQLGDANHADQEAAGSGNVSVIRQAGDENFLHTSQSGADNMAVARVRGDRNNRLLADVRIVLPQGTLVAGLIEQDGRNLRSTLDVAGSDNSFATRQIGQDHVSVLDVVGNANSVGVWQSGMRNTSLVGQYGNQNTFVISQF